MRALFILLIVIGGILILYFGLAFVIILIRKPKFTKKAYTILEKKLLEVFISMFNPNLAGKLKEQIKYFENKQKWRQYWGKSMSIELFDDNKSFPSDLKYPRKDESKIATIKFKAKDVNYSIEFNSYNGRIWGWKIRPNPKNIQKLAVIEITSKKINNDLNEEIIFKIEKTEVKTIPDFSGVIREIANINPIRKAYKPLNIEQIEFFINKIDSILPSGYLQIIEQTEGLDFNDFSILGISEIQRTGLDDGNYFHLVEFENGVIAIKEDDKTGELYYCHYSEGLIDKLGIDFNNALIEKCIH